MRIVEVYRVMPSFIFDDALIHCGETHTDGRIPNSPFSFRIESLFTKESRWNEVKQLDEILRREHEWSCELREDHL